MIIKNLFQYPVLVFFIATATLYAQNDIAYEKEALLEKQAKRANLTRKQIKKLRIALLEHEVLKKEYKDYNQNNSEVSVMYIWDKRRSNQAAEKQLYRKVAAILSPEEFKNFFSEQLNAMAQNGVREYTEQAKSDYNLSQGLLNRLEKELYPLFVNEALQTAYYHYDPTLKYNKGKEAAAKINEAYVSFLYQNDIALGSKTMQSEQWQDFTIRAKEAGLPDRTIQDIKTLYLEKESRLAQYKEEQRKLSSTSILSFWDKDFSEQTIRQDFKKNLLTLITREQYAALFKNVLESRIEREYQEKLAFFTSLYQPNIEQADKIAPILRENATHEVITEEYYSYDFGEQHIRRMETRHESASKFREGVIAVGLSYRGVEEDQEKIKNFSDKAKLAGINHLRVRYLSQLIAEREYQYNLAKYRSADDAKRRAVTFWFKELDRQGIKEEFRKKLSESLSLKEFTTIFGDDLKAYVDKKTVNEMRFITEEYTLDDKQQDKIHELVLAKNQEEAAVLQYYFYNRRLKAQKSREINYAFEKKYHKLLKQYGQVGTPGASAGKTENSQPQQRGFDWEN